MPYKPHNRCRICNKECDYGKAYCPEHQRQIDDYYEKNIRRKRSNEVYGSRWRKTRELYFSEHPFCEACGKPAQEVHHRVPLSRGGTNDFSNLISLCRSCHNKIHYELGDR